MYSIPRLDRQNFIVLITMEAVGAMDVISTCYVTRKCLEAIKKKTDPFAVFQHELQL